MAARPRDRETPAVAAPPPILCPVLVGRDDELEELTALVDRAAAGRGGVVAVVGDAGTGKSRLVAAAVDRARDRGLRLLTGRAVDRSVASPYRPLTEAFLGALRDRALPAGGELTGFERHLGRFVPAWQRPDDPHAEESDVVLAEGAARLLGVLASDRGAVLVLEDLHWSDLETLGVVDHFVEALTERPVLCVVTARPEAGDVLARTTRRRGATTIRLGPLDPEGTAALVTAALGGDPPPAVVDFVARHAEGNPLLAEELLAGLAGTGVLVHDGRWTVAGELTATVPHDMAQSVRARLATFDPEARLVVAAAAVMGRSFDWELLPGVAEVDARAVVEALRTAVDLQLVEVVGQGFRFRHALIREAVLAGLLPPERRALARRAWPAIERAHPGLPDPWCELAAELAQAAGDPAAAAERHVDRGRRALAAGAMSSAEAIARSAATLAGDHPVGLDAAELLTETLTLAGKPGDALEVGRALAGEMAAAAVEPARRAALAVTLARAAVAAGELDEAHELLDEARALIDAGAVGDLRPDADALAAHVALERGATDEASALAQRAVDDALGRGRAAVACEALEVVGRAARTRSSAEAHGAFARAADLAESHGLVSWSLRARHELALERVVDGDPAPLLEVRELAARHGALLSVAVMDLTLADLALSAMDRDGCFRHALACVDASRRYGLATRSVAELWLAGAHALAGDDAEMEAAATRALARDPSDPRVLADLWGRVRATRSILRDDRDQLRADLDEMVRLAELAPPGTSVFSFRTVWVVLRSIDDDDLGVAAQQRIESLHHLSWFTLLWRVLDLAKAITLGRQGESDAAAALAETVTSLPMMRGGSVGVAQFVALLVAEAQIRDSWGDPVPLLRSAEAFFSERGYDLVARRCRVALRSAGAPMPRRGRGDSIVPEHLRALGVTSREHDVLLLVVAGRTNREIAADLHLSPKTVERHVGSLFDRTGIRNRTELARWVSRTAN